MCGKSLLLSALSLLEMRYSMGINLEGARPKLACSKHNPKVCALVFG